MKPNRQDVLTRMDLALLKWLEKDAEQWFRTRALRKNQKLVKRLKRTNRRFYRWY